MKKPIPRRYYVYELMDPTADNEVFYVGKGKGARMYQHAANTRNGTEPNPFKAERIQQIHRFGGEVCYRITKDGLSEEQALKLERKTISKHGIENLTNIAPGQETERERNIARAKYNLARMKPYWVWSTQAERTDLAKERYWLILHFMREVARTGRDDMHLARAHNSKWRCPEGRNRIVTDPHRMATHSEAGRGVKRSFRSWT